jgi:hypothetical protein
MASLGSRDVGWWWLGHADRVLRPVPRLGDREAVAEPEPTIRLYPPGPGPGVTRPASLRGSLQASDLCDQIEKFGQETLNGRTAFICYRSKLTARPVIDHVVMPAVLLCAGLGLPADASVNANLGDVFRPGRPAVRAPQGCSYQARLQQVEAFEVRGDF